MSGENLYLRKDGSRECRQCARDRAKGQKAKLSGEAGSIPVNARKSPRAGAPVQFKETVRYEPID